MDTRTSGQLPCPWDLPEWAAGASRQPFRAEGPSTRDTGEMQLRDEVESGETQPADSRMIHRNNKQAASCFRHVGRRLKTNCVPELDKSIQNRPIVSRTGDILQYARVSTCGQDAAGQHDPQTEAVVIRVFTSVSL